MVNQKWIHRSYRLDDLQPRMRVRRRKHQCLRRGPLPRESRRYERLSMDFVYDPLFIWWSPFPGSDRVCPVEPRISEGRADGFSTRAKPP